MPLSWISRQTWSVSHWRHSGLPRFSRRLSPALRPEQPFRVLAVESCARLYPFRLKPDQQVGAISGCAVGYRLQTMGEPFGIGFPRAGYATIFSRGPCRSRDTTRHRSTRRRGGCPAVGTFRYSGSGSLRVAAVNSSPSSVAAQARSGFIGWPSGRGRMWARYQRRHRFTARVTSPDQDMTVMRGVRMLSPGISRRLVFSWPARTCTPSASPSKLAAHCAGQPMAMDRPQPSNMIR